MNIVLTNSELIALGVMVLISYLARWRLLLALSAIGIWLYSYSISVSEYTLFNCGLFIRALYAGLCVFAGMKGVRGENLNPVDNSPGPGGDNAHAVYFSVGCSRSLKPYGRYQPVVINDIPYMPWVKWFICLFLVGSSIYELKECVRRKSFPMDSWPSSALLLPSFWCPIFLSCRGGK